MGHHRILRCVCVSLCSIFCIAIGNICSFTECLWWMQSNNVELFQWAMGHFKWLNIYMNRKKQFPFAICLMNKSYVANHIQFTSDIRSEFPLDISTIESPQCGWLLFAALFCNFDGNWWLAFSFQFKKKNFDYFNIKTHLPCLPSKLFFFSSSSLFSPITKRFKKARKVCKTICAFIGILKCPPNTDLLFLNIIMY